MSSVVLSGDSSGTVTLTVPSAAGTNTATLPAATGTVMVSGNLPTFKARPTASGQSLTANTFAKITLGTKDWDTASCFDNTTNYRFTPNVAGYYQVSGEVGVASFANVICTVYKNGSEALKLGYVTGGVVCGSGLIYMNGTTDYIELYGRSSANNTIDVGGGEQTWFCASLVRTS